MNRVIVIIGSLLFLPILLPRMFSQGGEEEGLLEFKGHAKADYRYFPEEGLYEGQEQHYPSIAIQPELYIEWAQGNSYIEFVGFGRLDYHDSERNHFDIRELYWQSVFPNWELSIGAKKVFWGVAESNHLVDIVNQADMLEGFDLEHKLGQAMVHVSLIKDLGTIDFMLMPYFREMRFPGEKGRLRPPMVLDYEQTTYESELEEFNPDLALRWSHSFWIMDVGLSHFYGNSRLPLFKLNEDESFSPFYELINQSGLDIQMFTGSMLWKAEYIFRHSKRKTINAAVIGGEYTFSNLFQSGIDLGVLAEYSYDDRGLEELLTGLDNDVFAGLRLAFNDKQSTDFLGGAIIDLNNGTSRIFFEASRRLAQSWKLSLESNVFTNVAQGEYFYLLRKDSYLQISISKYF